MSSAPIYPRLFVVGVALATIVLTLGARLTYLGVVKASDLPPEHLVTEIEPLRGSIWDRDGALLVAQTFAYRVSVAPGEVTDAAALAEAAAPRLRLETSAVQAAALDTSRPWVPLAVDVAPSQARELEAMGFAGLHLEREPRRAYTLADAGAHVTGFVNAQDKAFYGLEERYDAHLRGHAGTVAGRYGSNPRAYRPPTDGTGLVLTIDRDLQLAAAEALADGIRTESATGGTVLVIEPATGAILASVSQPSYDPNHLADADPDAFVDPAVSAIYEPGSVLKVVTMAAALSADAVSPQSTYEDTGELVVGGVHVANWDRLAHGTTTMTELLQLSLNVGAVNVAERLGRDRFYDALAAFGFGTPTGVDLAGEVDGIVPWPASGGSWYEGAFATNAFGQGIASTPLQMGAAMAAIANGGNLMRPHIVRAVVTTDGQLQPLQPQFVRQAVSARAADETLRMLEAVVSGKVTQAAVPGYSVGGKTGTSQIPTRDGYDPDDTIASFAGFIPAWKPRLMILVKIDRGEADRGSEVAAPVFAEVARRAVEILDIPPDRPQDGAGDIR